MTDDLANFIDEYLAHVRETGTPNAEMLADDLINSLSWLDETGKDNPDAIDLIHRVRNVIRSNRPFAERLAEFSALMAPSKPTGAMR